MAAMTPTFVRQFEMTVVLQFPCREEQQYRALSAPQRAFAEHLLKIAPDYRYERSGLPKLKPAPAPGLASAIAAAKIMTERATR